MKKIILYIFLILCFSKLFSQSISDEIYNHAIDSITNYEPGIYFKFSWVGENSELKIQIEGQYYGLCKKKPEKVPSEYYEKYPRLPLNCILKNTKSNVLPLNKTDSFTFSENQKIFYITLDGSVDTYPEILSNNSEQKFVVQSPALYYPYESKPNIDSFLTWSSYNILYSYDLSTGFAKEMSDEEIRSHFTEWIEKLADKDLQKSLQSIFDGISVNFIYGDKIKTQSLELYPILEVFEIK